MHVNPSLSAWRIQAPNMDSHFRHSNCSSSNIVSAIAEHDNGTRFALRVLDQIGNGFNKSQTDKKTLQITLILIDWFFNFSFRWYSESPHSAVYCPLCSLIGVHVRFSCLLSHSPLSTSIICFNMAY